MCHTHDCSATVWLMWIKFVVYKVKIILFAGTYEMAVVKTGKAELTSNLETEPEQKRPRVIPARFQVSSDEGHACESDGEVLLSS